MAALAIENPAVPGKEFLESSYFIDSANAKVKELATTAVGDETDAWKKGAAHRKLGP